MGASNTDLTIIVISNGKKALYTGVKSLDHLLWDLRFGLYGSEKPDANRVFDFVLNDENTREGWQIQRREASFDVNSTSYGTVEVDFDKKRIIEGSCYHYFGRLQTIEWIAPALIQLILHDPLFQSTDIEEMKSRPEFDAYFKEWNSDSAKSYVKSYCADMIFDPASVKAHLLANRLRWIYQEYGSPDPVSLTMTPALCLPFFRLSRTRMEGSRYFIDRDLKVRSALDELCVTHSSLVLALPDGWSIEHPAER